MSYTTKVLHIDKDTFQEFEKASILQDLLIKGVVRPRVANPQYLLILKDTEFIVVDKQGNVVLRKTVGYTIDWGAINNDGKVAIISGADLYVYDINGNELYHTTFSANISPKLILGSKYLWLAINTSPVTVYVYDLTDFSYTSFTVTASSATSTVFSINELGDEAIIFTGDPSDYTLILRTADISGVIKEVDTGIKCIPLFSYFRPDLAGALVGGRVYASSWYGRVFLVNHNLDFNNFYTVTWTGDNYVYFVADINLAKALIFQTNTKTIRKYTLDLNTMSATEADTFELVENPENVGNIDNNGDMTPDGAFALITTSDILIINWETKEIVKTIAKSFANKPIKMIVA